MSIENPSATEYIQHHMQHLQSLHQQVIVDFSVFNYDTLFFSILSLLVVFFVLRLGAKKATSGVPGKMQCAVEMLVEMVNNQAKSIVHGDRTYIAPLALTVFCWVTIMNCIDLIPVDFFPLAGLVGINHLRPLPTADLNGTLGLSFGVLCLLFYYGIKVKGFSGFIIELFTAPFGKFPLLWPVNLLMNIIEYLAKFVSLGMRLFGNMYLPHCASRRLYARVWPFRRRCSWYWTSHRRFGLVALPCADCSVAGVHFHDADLGLYRPGTQ